jgi:hypothetical protein
MAVVSVQCPQCQGIYVVKYGKQANGTQRYRCNDPDCTRRIFLLQYMIPDVYQRSSSASWTSRSTAVVCVISPGSLGSVRLPS